MHRLLISTSFAVLVNPNTVVAFDDPPTSIKVVDGDCEYLQFDGVTHGCSSFIFQNTYESGNVSFWFVKSKEVSADDGTIIAFAGAARDQFTNGMQIEHFLFQVTASEEARSAEGMCVSDTKLEVGSIFDCRAIDYSGRIYRAKFISSVDSAREVLSED